MNRPLSSPLRWAASVLLLVTAATHLPMVAEHLQEAPYVGVLFVALSAVSLGLAVLLVLWDTPAVWAATGATTVLAVVGYLASRTVGLPQLGNDIGNWTEPLSFPALAAEALAAFLAASALRPRSIHSLHRPGKGTS